MSNLNLSVRSSASSDWPAIAALLEVNKLALDGVQAHLATYWVAVRDGEVVGTAGAEVYGNIALLRSVAVTPALQRQGIGRLLVLRLLEDAKQRQIGRVFLLTVTAPEYFAQFGFKRGTRDNIPAALQASAGFQGACTACTAWMSMTLPDTSPVGEGLPVAVLGAGPAGLAATARLIQRGMHAAVLEAGDKVGTNLLDYGHVRLFSTWQYNIDPAMAELLRPTGWTAPSSEKPPLAREVVEKVLAPFAALPQVAKMLRFGTRVVSVSREGFDKVKSFGRDKAPFVVHAVRHGEPVTIRARAVIDATGTWSTPNPLGANGLPATGEAELQKFICYGIPDILGQQRERYAGRRTLVVGAGHSAANALLALAELARKAPDTRFAWSVRSAVPTRVFGGGAADALPARGLLGSKLEALLDTGAVELIAGFRISGLRREHGTITLQGLDASGQHSEISGFDEVICATGQRPDLDMTRELRLDLDTWLESTAALGPLIDPNLHSCGTVRPHGHRELAHPEPGFYTLGAKSYGRAPTFLMATGFEQARSVVAAIAGDIDAADRVELELPQTGVCNLGTADQGDSAGAAQPRVAASGCEPKSCGVPAKEPAPPRKVCC